ncbi:MAG TPA: hypothetical protein VK993_08165, partial [Chthoniobacterales bacterium]|nr:hypothetical protein [Chthoniobacterales bacterium]
MSATTLYAVAPEPPNLGSGLANVIARDLAAKAGLPFDAPGTGSAVDLGDRAIRDSQGRILVTIFLKAAGERAAVLGLPGLQLKAEDLSYQGGALEAYVPAEQVFTLARLPGVSAVHLVVAPVFDVGATTTAGVVQHRVDKIANQAVSPITGITGRGITVGVMSDSFDTSARTADGTPPLTRAAEDVATGDLPGPGNPNQSEPVRVLEDLDAGEGTDEGRAMCQIIHDMAPRARIAYATAFGGEVSFANNIRRLAAPVTNNTATTGAGAQVIVDDVINLSEGMFQDTIVSRAVDQVAAQGVAYFSSAGNRPTTQGYFSDFRPVANGTGARADTNTALANTNINLTGVRPELYAGGFHNFNPATGQQDVAQTILIGTSAIFDFQWDDPYDVSPIEVGAVIASTRGTVALDPTDGNGTTTVNYTFTGIANQRVRIFADSDGTPTGNPDVTITLRDSAGNLIAFEDSGTSPDSLITFLLKDDTYTVQIGGFDATPATPGGESLGGIVSDVRNASGAPLVSTDFNVLLFRRDGSFIGALGE